MDMMVPTQGVMKYPRADVWASTPPVQRLQLQKGGDCPPAPAGSLFYFAEYTSQIHLPAPSIPPTDTQDPCAGGPDIALRVSRSIPNVIFVEHLLCAHYKCTLLTI